MSYRKLPQGQYYKSARTNGFDWYTGNTINYREAIGQTVKAFDFNSKPTLCSSSVLHACRNPNNVFIVSEIPLSLYVVSGKPVVRDKEKYGFKQLKVLEEIPHTELDKAFGWKYLGAENPIHPLQIKPPEITEEHVKLLKKWVSVRAYVRDSIRDSINYYVLDSITISILSSFGACILTSIWDFGNASILYSVGDSILAYLGSLFPIKKWKHVKHKQGEYPFQPAVDLWRQGLVASFNEKTWRLHGEQDAKILYSEASE